VLAGTIGYHFLEGMSYFEALYFTVTTITTVGYGDLVPKTTGGRIFTMILVLSGVFTMFYAATALIRTVVSGELAEHLGKQQMERTLAQMKDHIIVCGYGRMGKLVCSEFALAKIPFVIVDEKAQLLRDFAVPGGVPVVGDATADEVLEHAGVDRARALVTVMASDAANLYTTLSARLLNSKLFIVARVEAPHSEQKLLRAGANRVVSPYQIGGSRVAQAVLRPNVVDFIELATRAEHIELQLEEACIDAKSTLVGNSLKDSRLRSELKIIVVAVKKSGGHMLFNPDPETTLEAGDILLAIGHMEQLKRLEALANPS
jgi:voltage-gated potassium channel